jgi:beta-galactosidase
MTTSQPPSRRLHLGAAYYPEHWPETRWPEDIRLMRIAGLTVVRMAEFAWSTLEPTEGQFNFDWLDRAIALLADSSIASVLGTPTAAPPAWLVESHPELLAVDETGRRVQFGNRCHYCVTSPEFHEATRRIVGAMAKHFWQNPNVIGWQLDNEYNRVCTCERCQVLFRRFLVEKYGTLEELNKHWSTAYWSQTYSSWDQIPIPIGSHNPGLMLEFKHFVTQNYRKFQKLQLDELRPNLRPYGWVTHNFMGWYDGFDHYELSEELDLASWDWYIGTGHNDYLATSAIHALTRGFKRQNFWVMETQPGSVNWSPVNNMLNKFEARAMAWQAVAEGAEGILYWQWRSALGGQEQYHGSLVDQSGQPRLFYTEVQVLGKEFAAVEHLIAGTVPKARVAMLNDYDSRWSIQWQRHHKDFDYVAHFNLYYRALAARNIAVDILPAKAIKEVSQLAGYKMVILPGLLIVPEGLYTALNDFLRRGGHLVLTARCGMKDTYNALLPLRQPGLLSALTGLEVEEYYALDEPVPVKGNWFEGISTIWAERLRMHNDRTTSIIARYGKSNGWLDDQIAIGVSVTQNSLVYYVGTYLDPAAQQALIDRFLKTANINPPLEAPDGIQVRTRVNPEGEEIYFVINHTTEAKVVTLPWPTQEHLTGQPVPTGIKLGPYGVAILTKTKPPEPSPEGEKPNPQPLP